MADPKTVDRLSVDDRRRLSGHRDYFPRHGHRSGGGRPAGDDHRFQYLLCGFPPSRPAAGGPGLFWRYSSRVRKRGRPVGLRRRPQPRTGGTGGAVPLELSADLPVDHAPVQAGSLPVVDRALDRRDPGPLRHRRPAGHPGPYPGGRQFAGPDPGGPHFGRPGPGLSHHHHQRHVRPERIPFRRPVRPGPGAAGKAASPGRGLHRIAQLQTPVRNPFTHSPAGRRPLARHRGGGGDLRPDGRRQCLGLWNGTLERLHFRIRRHARADGNRRRRLDHDADLFRLRAPGRRLRHPGLRGAGRCRRGCGGNGHLDMAAARLWAERPGAGRRTVESGDPHPRHPIGHPLRLRL